MEKTESCSGCGGSCGECKFSVSTQAVLFLMFHGSFLTCRCNPPGITADGKTAWPKVKQDGWCGQFSPLGAVEPVDAATLILARIEVLAAQMNTLTKLRVPAPPPRKPAPLEPPLRCPGIYG